MNYIYRYRYTRGTFEKLTGTKIVIVSAIYFTALVFLQSSWVVFLWGVVGAVGCVPLMRPYVGGYTDSGTRVFPVFILIAVLIVIAVSIFPLLE